LSIYRVRIYTPFFPFPPQPGPSQLIYEQARRYAQGGYDTEIVFWKEPAADASKKLRLPHFKGFDDRIVLTSLSEPGLERVPLLDWDMKVERASFSTSRPGAPETGAGGSLLSPLTPAELYHYPLELDQRERLKPVSLAIYHFSSAYAWLRSQSEAVKKLEPTQIVHFHQVESERELARARTSSWIKRPAHHLNGAKLWRNEKALAAITSELWFAESADLKLYEQRVPEAGVKLAPVEYDPDDPARPLAPA
jgi:hypothetical protein